ncbi:MAG: ribonuclease P protein component [Eubacteriales bacterium]|jgi:ribonuclease P protein component|nr:ribonuclease P protein component [Lachnospiraceae bacterium]MCH4063595.1 ribonuclease P protein component [Lachnospiraceae bacterium]MCH4103681.1 ribonuclease P protein component [Lachnospiraceae bacterium]MDD5859620.1 ribonuclease P protein component [Eubacteriales bacterium]
MTGIKKNDDFSRVYREGRSCADRRLVMYVLDSAAGDENEVPANRLGISVSKKVGNSVVRHRIKRRLKEIARLNEDGVKKGYDIVIIARNAAALSGYGELEQSYLRLLTKMHLMDMDAVR